MGPRPLLEDSRNLIADARRGDRAALESLVVSHLDGLRGYIRLRCGREVRELESTMDLVQSVCREALEDLGGLEYRGESAFRHWLYTAAEHKIQDRARYWGRAKREAGKRAAALEESAVASALACYATICTPSEAASARERMELIESAFDRLPEGYRDVILLSRVVGLTHEEIAERTGHTPHYTRTLLSRALARLSTLLDERRP